MESSESRKSSLSRRRFFGAGITIGAGAALGKIAIDKISAPPKPSLQEKIDPLQKLKKMEVEIGNGEITFEKPQQMLPHMVEVFHSYFKPTQTREQLTKRTLFLRPDSKEIEAYQKTVSERYLQGKLIDINDIPHPAIGQFKSDYPQLAENQRLQTAVGFTRLGLTSDDGVLINLTAINTSNTDESRARSRLYNIQADSISSNATCEPATNFHMFLNTVFHEFVHDQIKQSDGKVVEPRLLNAFNAIKREEGKPEDYQQGRVAGMRLGFFTDKVNTFIPSQGFEEYCASYLSSRLLLDNVFPYVAVGRNDTAPKALHDFQLVLKQSGISDEELVRLHQNSAVEEVAMKLAKGARNTNFSSDQEALQFGLKMFLSFDVGSQVMAPNDYIWQVKYKQHFPDISLPTKEEIIFLPGVNEKNDIGCVNIDILLPK